MPGRSDALPIGTVTFLFSDVEGSTRLVESLGEGWPSVLAKHREIFRNSFAQHRGFEMGTEGDSFFVVFAGAPDAVRAAVDGQRGLAIEPWPPGGEIRVRIGLHTGDGRLMGGDYVGLDVHRAARIAAAAHGGQVVLSDTTRALAEHELPDGAQLRDLGWHRLKDIPDPEHLFQLEVPGLPLDFPPLRAEGRGMGNLPTSLTSFVGREREAHELESLLRTSRLVTLVGPAGTGKTRLMLEVAHGVAMDFRDGAWFVGLESLADASQLPAAIAAAVGVREVGGKPVAAVLIDHLRPRQCLVVLDNFEQLIDQAPFIVELLQAAPGLTVAVTSQTELRLSGEHLYPVPPLSADPSGTSDHESDAVRLFVARAASSLPGFRATPESARVIAAICARLDGLPLGIELAAARVRFLGLEEILRRLDDRLALLSAGPSDAPDRHRTLRAALAWSHDLLGPAEAAVFRRLAVFNGGASLPAVEQVCARPNDVDATAQVGDVLAALDELVRHSLVQVDLIGEGTRYRMLDTIREFALERLAESGEAAEIHRHHANWCAGFLESMAPTLRLRPSVARLAEPEMDNVQAALEWAAQSNDVGVGLRICGSAWRVWERRRILREGLALTQAFLGRDAGGENVPYRLRALDGAGAIAYWLNDNATAVEAYRERLELASREGLASEIADAHLDLCYAFSNLGDLQHAEVELAAARSGYEALDDQIGIARCRWLETSRLVFARRFGEALERLEALLHEFRAEGDEGYVGLTLGSLAMCTLAMGDLAAADRRFRDVLTIGESANPVGVVTGLEAWSQLLGVLGHPRLGARLRGAYEALSETYGIQGSPRLREIVALVLAQVQPAEELDAEERERLIEEGRRLTFDDVLEIARTLALRDSLPPDEAAPLAE